MAASETTFDMVGASPDDQQGEELVFELCNDTVLLWTSETPLTCGDLVRKLAIFAIVNIWYVIKNDV